MNTNKQQYDEIIKPIERIEFDIFGWHCNCYDNKPNSVFGKQLGIEIPDLYDNMDPKRSGGNGVNGIIDTRLGMTMTSPLDATYSIDESVKILPN